MDLVVAIVVAILNGLVLAYLQRAYDAELSRRVTIAYVCTFALRYAPCRSRKGASTTPTRSESSLTFPTPPPLSRPSLGP